MIIRIVKMQFREDTIEAFRSLFEERKVQIRNFKGCEHLELWQDANEPEVLFTYSHWQSEADLNHYRYSAFFKETWALTKALFAVPAEATSITRIAVVD